MTRTLTGRRIEAFAAPDTIDTLAERVEAIFSHGRRVSLARRYLHDTSNSPELDAGLTVDEINRWRSGDGIGVNLSPGIRGFRIHFPDGYGSSEAEIAERYHRGDRTCMTLVTVLGGIPGDGPARDDKLIVREWNVNGVCTEYVVAFDYAEEG